MYLLGILFIHCELSSGNRKYFCPERRPQPAPPPLPSSPPISHLQQLVLLALQLSHVLVERDRNPLRLGAAPRAHAQLGQLVAHGAVKRGEVLGNGSLPAHFLSSHRGGAGRLLDLCAETRELYVNNSSPPSNRSLNAFYCPNTC